MEGTVEGEAAGGFESNIVEIRSRMKTALGLSRKLVRSRSRWESRSGPAGSQVGFLNSEGLS